MKADIGEGGGGVDLVTLIGQNAELEQTGDPEAGKSQATGSPGRAGLVRHPSLPGGRGRTEWLKRIISWVWVLFTNFPSFWFKILIKYFSSINLPLNILLYGIVFSKLFNDLHSNKCELFISSPHKQISLTL